MLNIDILNKIMTDNSLVAVENGKHKNNNDEFISVLRLAYEMHNNVKIKSTYCIIAIDNDSTNLQKENLIMISTLHKVAMSPPTKANKTGYKGVSAIKRGKQTKFRATASKWIGDYKLVAKKEFESVTDAAIYYNKIIVEFYGSKVYLNEVEESFKALDDIFGE